MNMAIHNLLFIDTNIWLDFYRARTETGLKLLAHTEAISDQVIVTYQLESEFKRNRQAAIIEGMQELKAPQQMSQPGIFSDAKAITTSLFSGARALLARPILMSVRPMIP